MGQTSNYNPSLSSMEKANSAGIRSEGLSQDDENNIPVNGITMSDAEKALNRRVNLKMDFFILPVLALLYLLNGIDRSNVGNAQTDGLTTDLGISPNSVNNAVTLFYITFLIFQPISAAAGKRFGVKRWIPFLMVCWGTFTMVHAWVKSEGQLIAFRLMIGVFEAGFYPCALYYLSSCYLRFDLARRIAILYGCYAVAGAFSGVLAYGLLQISSNLYGWQWLFIIEGALTMGLGVFGFFWLPRDITTAWFLKEEERAWTIERMLRDSGGRDSSTTHLSRADLVEAFKDWKFWLVLPCNIAASVPNQAFSVFLPIIVKALGYSSYKANLFSVPIYLVGAVGLVILTSLSDWKRDRSSFILVSLLFVLTGLVMVVEIESAKGRYAALCVLQIGAYSAPPLTAAWLANNTPEPGKRALILGFNGWGNLAGIIGSQLFRANYGPRYRLPFLVSLGICVFSIVGYCLNRLILMRCNRRRAAIVKGWTEEERKEENQSTKRLGDKKMTFVYNL